MGVGKHRNGTFIKVRFWDEWFENIVYEYIFIVRIMWLICKIILLFACASVYIMTLLIRRQHMHRQEFCSHVQDASIFININLDHLVIVMSAWCIATNRQQNTTPMIFYTVSYIQIVTT